MNKTLQTLGLSILIVLLFPLSSTAQTPRNPTTAVWDESSDHATIDTYAMDIVRRIDDVVLRTLDLGLGTLVAGATRTATFNVMPIEFGTYYCVLRAVGAGIESDNSDPSNDWDRAPGRPSSATVQ